MSGCVQRILPDPIPGLTLPRGLRPPLVPTLSSRLTSCRQLALTPPPQTTPEAVGAPPVGYWGRTLNSPQVPQGHLPSSQNKVSLRAHGCQSCRREERPLSRWEN